MTIVSMQGGRVLDFFLPARTLLYSWCRRNRRIKSSGIIKVDPLCEPVELAQTPSIMAKKRCWVV